MADGMQPPWRRPTQRPMYQTSSQLPRKRAADTQEETWVADEDRFVLKQAKKKAEVRVREGRGKPIDWLAVTLRFIEPSRDAFDDDVEDTELDVVDPEGVFEGLDDAQLHELGKDISVYLTLETHKNSREFWETMKIICENRLRNAGEGATKGGRAAASISGDVDKLFASKSAEELETLEKQIRIKLRSNEPIDYEYWEQLLKNLTESKARAKLRQLAKSIVDTQLHGLRKQQVDEARLIRESLHGAFHETEEASMAAEEATTRSSPLMYPDPESTLTIRVEDRDLDVQDEEAFLVGVVAARRRVLKLGYISRKHRENELAISRNSEVNKGSASREPAVSLSTTTSYDREVARGVGENEEVFTTEEQVSTTNKAQWSNKYRPRKPKYFNRVQMGYEWNKYNQTHYDHDNPPPKVVQGYKLNLFYPDLIDPTKAPTYKIERENGRKRGQSFAPAGEEDTCLIRFIAGPPYEDVAFRIVDKEWDYSAKRERGFKSSFDKGILQLHFQFKKIFYRK